MEVVKYANMCNNQMALPEVDKDDKIRMMHKARRGENNSQILRRRRIWLLEETEIVDA